jgi:hypothetical protein
VSHPFRRLCGKGGAPQSPHQTICHPEQSEGSAFALTFLSVIPEGNLLLSFENGLSRHASPHFKRLRRSSQNARFPRTQAEYQRGIVMKDWGIALWMAALASFFLWSALDARRRARSIAALASKLGLKSWGNQLPPDLSLRETPMAHASATWNVIEGVQNGVPFIVFDCRIGTGKASWRRTVIAVRSSRDVFATVPSDSSYTMDRSGEWMVFYSPQEVSFFGRRLMPIAELEARISTLG